MHATHIQILQYNNKYTVNWILKYIELQGICVFFVNLHLFQNTCSSVQTVL